MAVGENIDLILCPPNRPPQTMHNRLCSSCCIDYVSKEAPFACMTISMGMMWSYDHPHGHKSMIGLSNKNILAVCVHVSMYVCI